MDVFDLLDDHEELREYFYQTVKPLTKTLLRFGFPVDTAVDLLRLAYLNSYKEADYPGERKGIAHCMYETGLTRTQIRRLGAMDHPVDFRRANRRDIAAQMLREWATNQAFQYSEDKPYWLPVDADEGPSFKKLARHFDRYVDYYHLLTDLLASGSVEIHAGGIRLVNPTYGADGMDCYKLENAGLMAHRHGHTVDFNVGKKAGQGRHLHRMWRRMKVPREREEEVRDELSRLGEQTGRHMDSYLDGVAHEQALPGQEYVEMGVVIFTYALSEATVN